MTEHQTAGRGRSGRSWTDAVGRSILCSVLLRPPYGTPVEQLSLVTGLAVAAAIEIVTGWHAQVKWPNDVLLDRFKVAGVLLESVEGAVICGIGVNVAQTEAELPAETRISAGSLLTTTGREHDRTTLLVTVLEILEYHYDDWVAFGLDPFLPGLERRDALRGKQVVVGSASGTAAGIAADGRLLLRDAGGRETLVASGEVSLLDA